MKHTHTVLLFIIIFMGCVHFKSYFNLFYNAKRDYEEAIKTEPPSTQKLDKVIERCGKIIKYYPTSRWVPDAVLLMGKAFLAKGEYSQAEEKFREFITFFPEHKACDEARYMLAETYIKQGDLIKARELLEPLISTNKGQFCERAYYLLIQSYFEEHAYYEAIDKGEQFLKRFPKSSYKGDVLLTLGAAYDSLHEYEHAATMYQQALQFATRKNPILIKLARAEILMGNVEEGLNRLEELRKRVTDPTEEEAIALEMARGYIELGDTNRAIDLLQKYTNSVNALVLLAEIHEWLCNYKEAAQYYDEITKKGDPLLRARASLRKEAIDKLLKYEADTSMTDTSIFRLAELYLFEFDQLDKARQYYLKVWQDYPQSRYAPKAGLALAWIARHKDDNPELACKYYEAVIKRYPNTYYARKASELLNAVREGQGNKEQ
ncbi:tetratricopeptide repeat protein [candidate division WOR-3 bacterium]|nr:tetratricopeptide repeat protein [candidate division WOR-3 bacterium]